MKEFAGIPQLSRNKITDPQVEMADIFAVQSLAMGYLRYRAQTRSSDYIHRRYGFAMSNATPAMDINELYDGSEDSMLSCVVRKVGYDQWRMRVSFLHLLRTPEAAESNMREVYAFDWLKSGNRMAWAYTKLIDHDGGERREVIINGHPINANECGELRVRMSEMSESINPLLPGSIYSPLSTES